MTGGNELIGELIVKIITVYFEKEDWIIEFGQTAQETDEEGHGKGFA